MIDRNSPVTEDELHAYVDGELPADRREAVDRVAVPSIPSRPRGSPPGARRPKPSARATARSPRSRCRSGSSSTSDAQRRRSRRSLGGDRGGGRGRRLRGRRRRRLDGARRLGRRAGQRRRRSPPTRSKRTSSTSSRCAIRSRCRATSAHHMTQWLSKRLGYAAARARSAARSASSWSAAGCCRDRPARPRSTCMKAPSASASRSIARKATRRDSALRFREGKTLRRVLLGRRQGRLCGERAGRPRPSSRQVTKAVYDRSTRREEVVACASETAQLGSTRVAESDPGRAHSGIILARIVGLARRASSSSAPRARRRRPPAARCARWRADRRRRSLALRPLPLRRKVRPELVPAGIASSTAPSSVGTRTLPPSTAS